MTSEELQHFTWAIATVGFIAGLAGAGVMHLWVAFVSWVTHRFMAWEERAERIATARARAVAFSKAMPRG